MILLINLDTKIDIPIKNGALTFFNLITCFREKKLMYPEAK